MNYPEKARRVIDIEVQELQRLRERIDGSFSAAIDLILARISERLPIFDLWPIKYATSYEFVPGPECPTPPSPFDPRFRACHTPVGNSPEVDIGLKWLGVRVFTAFGSGLSPIL